MLDVGDKIQMLKMENEPNTILPGDKGGDIRGICAWQGQTQVKVDWESGRTLMILVPEVKVKLIN